MSKMFRCLACNEMIFANAGTCRFCGAAIDRAAAQSAARQQAIITNACSLANNMKLAWYMAPTFVVGQLLLVFLSVESPRFWFIIMALPPGGTIASLAWLWKYRSVVTNDPDFPMARKSVIQTMILWLAALVLQLLSLGVVFLNTRG